MTLREQRTRLLVTVAGVVVRLASLLIRGGLRGLLEAVPKLVLLLMHGFSVLTVRFPATNIVEVVVWIQGVLRIMGLGEGIGTSPHASRQAVGQLVLLHSG
jgi:hypothetical protein